MINTPTKTLSSLPLPPDILTPPKTTAVKTSSSSPWAVAACPLSSLEESIAPPMPAISPQSKKTTVFIFFTLIPEITAASSLLPIA